MYTARAIYLSLLLLIMAVTPATAQNRFTLIVAPQTDTRLDETTALKLVQVMAHKLIDTCGPVSFAFGFVPLPSGPPPLGFQGAANGGSGDAMNRFRKTNTSLQIVPSISHCPISEAQAGGIFGGCTAETGPILLRDYPSRTSEERLRLVQKWAHEIGHAQRLGRDFPGYVNAHNPSPGTLLYWQAGLDNWQMTTQECARLYQAQTFPPPPQVAAIIEPPEGHETKVEAPLNELTEEPLMPSNLTEITPIPPDEIGGDLASSIEGDEFLRGDWMDGLPIDAIAEGGDDLLRQAEVAVDQNMVTLWPGSAIVIAYSGGDGALERLEKILTGDVGELDLEAGSDAAFQVNEAKIRAAGALSYLPYRMARGEYSGSDAGRAREILDQRLSPSANADLPLADDGRGREMLAQEITLNAILGLALLAGFDNEAFDRLNGLRISNNSGDLPLGVDDGFFESLDSRVRFDRANRLPQTMPLAEALRPRQ